MPIVSSQIISQTMQRSGVLVTEAHLDSAGGVHRFEYLAGIGGVAIEQTMLDRVDYINKTLKDAEYVAIISDLVPYAQRVENTTPEFVVRIRADYANSSGEQTAKLAVFIMRKIEQGVFSEAVAISLLGIDQTTWDSYKAKMAAIIAAYAVIETAKGE